MIRKRPYDFLVKYVLIIDIRIRYINQILLLLTTYSYKKTRSTIIKGSAYD